MMEMKCVVYGCAALLLLLNDSVAFAQEKDTSAIAPAVTRSLGLLQASGRTWIRNASCVSCHHQALPAISVALAKSRGFRVDEDALRERIATTLSRFTEPREELFQGPAGIGLVGGACCGLAMR